MAEQYEGNGVDYTYAGIDIDPVTLEVPGFTKEPIDISNLTNTAWMTKVVAALANSNDFVLTCGFDPAEYTNIAGTSNGTFVITFADSSNLTFYADVSAMDNIPQENGTRPLYSITFTVTNQNAGVETAPAYSAT